MSLLKNYENLKAKHQEVSDRLKKQFDLFGIFRLLLILGILAIIYFLIVQPFSYLLLSLLIISVISFFFVLNFHANIKFKLGISNELLKINQDEISLLNGENVNIENGERFLDSKHLYAYDLDIFGHKSLYQYLNRTATFLGENKLADLLSRNSSETIILQNQEAIKELKSKVDWRQEVLAYSRIAEDNEITYKKLKLWVEKEDIEIPKWLQIIAFILPAVLIGSTVLYYFTKENFYFDIMYRVFLLNMILVFSQFKKMKSELSYTSHIEDIMRSFSLIISKVENEEFKAEKLLNLKASISSNNILASQKIKELSKLFSQVSSLLNAFGSTILNGLFMYHIHAFTKLSKWKKENTKSILHWFDVVAEIEALNSFATFSYNNPTYVYPEINNEKQIEFKDLGHPLLKETQRVNNDVSFTENRFVILTGSNMSGKSTFLRSVGVNMVLAAAGAPVCATKANVHPMPILVSMRLMDSLTENESYFFAEVKRLKEIKTKLEQQTSFVLLDEILRGTNSDDKQQGTIEVIKQMISKGAIGVIATHDLEVCNTTKEFPNILCNKNFEVEIVNNELQFDYKLRDGICKNKSATFLMKKMDVI